MSTLLICAILYLHMGREKVDNSDERLILFGYSFIYFGLFMLTLFIFISDLHVPGTFVNGTFYGNYNETGSDYDTFIKIAYTINPIGFFLFYYTFEKIYKRTRYIITIFNSISLIIILILPFQIVFWFYKNIYYLGHNIALLYVLLEYSKLSRLGFKGISSFIMFGSMILTLAYELTTSDAKEINKIPLIVSPLLIILGTIICMIPPLVKNSSFSTASIFWCSTLNIILYGIFIFYFIFLRFPFEYIIVNISILVFIVFSLYYTSSIIKKEVQLDSGDEFKDYLSVFTRPKRVTEEEVSISKEKKVCLICKGKALGTVFICRSCESFYCEKCYHAIANLENSCWACNTALDESKSVKLEKKKDDLVIEPERHKQKIIKGD